MANQQRNEKCNCGSGKKFKHCCLSNQSQNNYSFLSTESLKSWNKNPNGDLGKEYTNDDVLQMLQKTEHGFNQIFQLRGTENRTYTIYEPILDETDGPNAKEWIKKIDTIKWGEYLSDRQLIPYIASFGMVECDVFDYLDWLEDNSIRCYENMMGSAPYEKRTNGDYRCNILIVQKGKKVEFVTPLLDFSWHKKEYEFTSAFGGSYKLPHILSLVASNLMISMPSSGFNPNAEQDVKRFVLKNKFSNFGINDRTIKNLLDSYESLYTFKHDLMASRKGLFTEAEMSNFWRVLD